MIAKDGTSGLTLAESLFRVAVVVIFVVALQALIMLGYHASRQYLATARCHDGTFSVSLHPRGTCSCHGGVNTWLIRPV